MKSLSCSISVALAAAAPWAFAATAALAQAPTAAQAAARPPAYYLSEFELNDPEGIRPYSAAVEATFKPFGGRYAVRGGQVLSLEGAPPRRVIVIAFPSLE